MCGPSQHRTVTLVCVEANGGEFGQGLRKKKRGMPRSSRMGRTKIPAIRRLLAESPSPETGKPDGADDVVEPSTASREHGAHLWSLVGDGGGDL